MDVMRFAIDLALLIWAAWATWAYFRWKEIADDLHDEIEGADDALRDARKQLSETKEELHKEIGFSGTVAIHVARVLDLEKETSELTALCEKQRDEIAELKRRKGKPMPCKGKKTGKGKRGK